MTSASVVRSSPIAAGSRSWYQAALFQVFSGSTASSIHDDDAVAEPPEREQFAAVVIDLEDLRLLVDLERDRRYLGVLLCAASTADSAGMPA